MRAQSLHFLLWGFSLGRRRLSTAQAFTQHYLHYIPVEWTRICNCSASQEWQNSSSMSLRSLCPYSQTPWIQFCSYYKVIISKYLLQRKQFSVSMRDNERSVLPWKMFAEKDPYGNGTLKAEARDFHWPGNGWRWWNTMVFPLSWLMPELSCCLGCHFHPSYLLCCISSSLYSLGLPFHLSDLTLHSPLPDCQSSSLIWGLAHFLQEAKFGMALSTKES